MATTCAPSITNFSVSTPSPHPKSRMRSPDCGLEQIQHRLPEGGDETSIFGISSRIPMLGGLVGKDTGNPFFDSVADSAAVRSLLPLIPRSPPSN